MQITDVEPCPFEEGDLYENEPLTSEQADALNAEYRAQGFGRWRITWSNGAQEMTYGYEDFIC